MSAFRSAAPGMIRGSLKVARFAAAIVVFAGASCAKSSGGASSEVTAPCGCVNVAPETATLRVGQTLSLVASAQSGDSAVTWTSVNTAVATVSSAGLVSAVATGSVVVTARRNALVGSASITVVQ